ncbi:MAG: ferritin-like domain-containing protein [Polyangiales bacterium]
MRGNSEIIECLNALLANELTAIDQYLVQARMLEDWGFTRLQERIGHEADDERAHADRLVKRILFLEGQPDMASRVGIKIGSDPKEMLEELLRDTEEDHIFWLEQQLSLIEKVGVKNCLQEQL